MFFAVTSIMIALELSYGLEFLDTPPEHLIVPQDTTLSLTCTTEPSGAPITWYYQRTSEGQEYPIAEGNSLIYPNIQTGSEGIYSCSAELGEETIRSNKTELRIAYLKQQFLKVPSQVYTLEGSTVEFECSPPASYPEAEVSWVKDGEQINNSRSYILEDHTLVIVGILSEDSGNYQCRATNQVTSQTRYSLEGELYVYKIPQNDTGEINFEAPQPSIKSYYAVFMEEEATKLLCGFQGVPYPTYAWYFDNGTEVSDSDYRVSYEHKKQVLQIHEVTRDMAGVFVCEGSNSAGTSFINVTVFVNYTEPLEFKKYLPDTLILPQYSNESRVECMAGGSPPVSISWYSKEEERGGVGEEEEEEEEEEEDEEGYILLSSSPILTVDTNTVQNRTVMCKAENRDGEIFQEMRIVVEEAAIDDNATEDHPLNVEAEVQCLTDKMRLILKSGTGTSTSQLHLMDSECSYPGNSTEIDAPLDGCGTLAYYNSTHIIYKNQIARDDTSDTNDVISRENSLQIYFECAYRRTGSTSSVEWDAIGRIDVEVKGVGTFTFTLDMYTDAGFSSTIGRSQYPVKVVVQDNIYLGVSLLTPDDNLSLSITDIVASDNPGGTEGSYRYDLVTDGCIRDPTFEYIETEELKTKRFKLKAFNFLNSASMVYIHAFVRVCNLTEYESCAKVCGNRKRSAGTDWRNVEYVKYHIFQGPFVSSTRLKVVSSCQTPKMDIVVLVLLYYMAMYHRNR